MDSPTKSVMTQSTGNATMVNSSPTKSTFSPTSATSNIDLKAKMNRDIDVNKNNLPSTEMIQQQSLAYPKMEMNMNNLMIPTLNSDSKTQSIYINEPSLR